MILIFISLFFVLASFGGMLYLAGRKIPLLRLVPEQLINESFLNRPSRLKTWGRMLVAWHHERKHIHWFLYALESLLRRVRIAFLKLENTSLRLMKKVQEKKEEHALRTNEQHNSELNRWKKENGIGKQKQAGSKAEIENERA
ncbi:hypothetical protein KGQ34_03245 [Patescibacteria group bacterium]|nr:hypothetical protein [Patescibacteria group bacterium]